MIDNNMLRKITLNRKQVKQLGELAEHFAEIDKFVIEQSNESGIGPTLTVTIDLFGKNDTKVNITDVESW